MNTTNQQKHITHFIKSICKGKTKEELQQAELNYLRFIKLAERVSNRLSEQNKACDP